jgi:polyisoprenoid-binding protein YceI
MQSAPASVAVPGYRAGTWKADPAHTEIAFSARHLMISKVRGRFTGFDLTIVTGDDPLGSSATATIDLTSVDTGNETRDTHLRSADFLAVEQHPAMTYRSTGVRRSSDGWIVDGELTLRGVTRPVPLAVELNGFTADPWGGQRAGFSASAQIDRRDFGIAPAVPADAVGDKVWIDLEIQAVLQE